MKLFLQYLKGHQRMIVLWIVFCIIFAVSFLLYHLPLKAVLYPAMLCAGIGAVSFCVDFFHVKQEHEAIQRIKTMTDIVTEHFPETENIPCGDYQEMIRRLLEEHKAYCRETDSRYENMMEYYTVWAHQMKTPIASMRLYLQKEDSALSRKLTMELYRIEQYADMVLTFLRLDSDSTDYVFREYALDDIVKSAVRKFSSEFISRGLCLVYQPLHQTVLTDEKWLSFVIGQVLSNALKYTPSGSITIFLAEESKLCIRDTGIGIAAEDLPRIFENGYTGYNGRIDRKASGIGLYLCKRICMNLGHHISASSTVDVGTVITIDLRKEKLEVE